MNDPFSAIYPRLVDLNVSMEEVIPELRNIGDFSDDLLEAMEAQLEARNVAALTRLVHVVFLTPSQKFTPLLCDLLDHHRYDGYMEAIADAFIDIRDERAVASMIGALGYFGWWDADSHFNRKLILALKQVGTEAAIAGIKEALESPKELVSEEAARALRDLGRL